MLTLILTLTITSFPISSPHAPPSTSFTTHPYIGTCILYSEVLSSLSNPKSYNGFQAYDNAASLETAGKSYGAPCSTTDQCTFPHHACVVDTCRCDVTHVYDPSAGSCVDACAVYGDEFVVYPSHTVDVTYTVGMVDEDLFLEQLMYEYQV